ncbi:predicted protein [Aspergillus terreus NIH2624]|uniref:Uncharacterized protein n=1 Tax=Aspergillus terreus (strain NIH 2624 / FGSC A1156) TaxID=341663 RepID=Q0CRU9_ASPTN|nr:uncharacterized protein ATEG_03585 [Aspergillus terreus NIH2624]EAU35387.1 predicted protein [Aspergillus terreus NIH2624]
MCRYLVANMKSMRKHWQTVHQWSQYPERGRGPQSQQAARTAELQRSYETAWEQAEAARTAAPVEATQLHDANPWLRMTRWTEYLQDIPPAGLIHNALKEGGLPPTSLDAYWPSPAPPAELHALYP